MESELAPVVFPNIHVLLQETNNGRVPVTECGSRAVMGYVKYTISGTLSWFLQVPTFLPSELHAQPQKIVVMGNEGMQTVHISMCRDVRIPVLLPDDKGVFRTVDGTISVGELQQLKLFIHRRLGVYFICTADKTEEEILIRYKELRAKELDDQMEILSRKVETMST